MLEDYIDKIICGNCLEVMASMEPDSIDSIVTDPPYGLSFMGKDWDRGVPGVPFWEQALRVAKPGAHLLAFGGTRTFHRLMVAIEDSGWEIRDTVMWVYGSGFPKSHDVSKAINKMAGAKREVVGKHPNIATITNTGRYNWNTENQKRMESVDITVPATDEAKQWNGWGTALKPAWEPVIVARKPFKGTVAENVLKYSTGALNIDGCRVAHSEPIKIMKSQAGGNKVYRQSGRYKETTELKSSGRWPANLIHDGSDEVMELFPNGAQRFFYCAKANERERNAGCEGLEEKKRDKSRNPEQPSMNGGVGNPYNRGVKPVVNHHPTVKPVTLMRYLVRLVTPPGGIVLDPFCGSGSTGVAAIMEGFSFLGIDISEEYCEIAKRRIVGTNPSLFTVLEEEVGME